MVIDIILIVAVISMIAMVQRRIPITPTQRGHRDGMQMRLIHEMTHQLLEGDRLYKLAREQAFSDYIHHLFGARPYHPGYIIAFMQSYLQCEQITTGRVRDVSVEELLRIGRRNGE